MKARVATMLSLTGVLVAGSAAALVNTQVLRNTAPAGNSVSQLVTAEASSTSADAVTVPAPSSSATTSTVAADDQKIYEIQGTARVTFDTSKDVLRIVSVEGIAPWQPLSQRQIDATHVEVRFVNADAVVVFTAAIAGDDITYQLGMDSLSTPTSATTPTSSSSAISVPQGGGSQGTVASTPTSVHHDDDNKATTSTDDSGKGGKGGGGGGGDDDHPEADD